MCVVLRNGYDVISGEMCAQNPSTTLTFRGPTSQPRIQRLRDPTSLTGKSLNFWHNINQLVPEACPYLIWVTLIDRAACVCSLRNAEVVLYGTVYGGRP